LGAAGTAYARSVTPKTAQPAALPEPETLFDSLLARKSFKEHPNKISSTLFYLASIIIHGKWIYPETALRSGVKTISWTHLTFTRPFPDRSERQLDLTNLFIPGPVSSLW